METTKVTFGQKAGEIAVTALQWAGTALQWTAAIIALLVLSPFALVYWTIVFNPVSFWVWAMVCPRSAANSCEERGTKELTSSVHRFLWNLNLKFRRFLPWRSRKIFVWETRFEDGTMEEHLRLFRMEGQLQAEILLKDWLTREEKNILWPEVRAELRVIMMPTMRYLSQEQIEFLIRNGEWNLFQQYVAKHTLSEEVLCILLDEATKNATALNFLCMHTRIHGLSARVITRAYELGSEEMMKELEKALESYRQRSMVKAYTADLNKWAAFLEDLGKAELFEENQKLMNLRQYDVYRRILGRKLSEGAILHFLAQDDLRMANFVLFEVKDNINLNSNKIKSLIASRPELAKAFLEL